MPEQTNRIRIAAVGDIHYGRSQDTFQTHFSSITNAADILLLLGDLTNNGLQEEAQKLARDLTATVKIPIIAILGNHDYESGKADDVRQILKDAGVTMLDGEACEVKGVGFAGVKGFGGGFDRGSLQPWGEDMIKLFVREAVNEAVKLEAALAKLRTPQRIALLHYAPVRKTVEGEPLEIYPFLGSSRLEDPVNRNQVAAVFHGHAHGGTLEGRTSTNIPVYNVSLPILQRTFPERPPFYVLELQAQQLPASAAYA